MLLRLTEAKLAQLIYIKTISFAHNFALILFDSAQDAAILWGNCQSSCD